MLSSDIYRRFLVGFIVDEAHCVKKWYVDRHWVELYSLFVVCIHCCA